MDQTFDLSNELVLLQSRLKQRDDKIADWLTEGTKNILGAESHKHAEVMRKGTDDIKMLNSAIASKEQQAAERNQSLEDYCKQVENLKAELLKLNSYSDELRIRQKQTESDKVAVIKDIDDVKSCIESQSKTRDKLEYLNKACGSFENVLGLSFKKTKGKRMQVIFTNIDERDPSMQFYFFLQIQDGSRKYIVTDPVPAISGIPELVEKLNDDNNIRAFIIDIRQKFKETLQT